MIGHLVAMLVSAVAFFGAILLYGAFSPRRLKGWKFWLCFAVYCALMEGPDRWQTGFIPLAESWAAVWAVKRFIM